MPGFSEGVRRYKGKNGKILHTQLTEKAGLMELSEKSFKNSNF